MSKIKIPQKREKKIRTTNSNLVSTVMFNRERQEQGIVFVNGSLSLLF